MCSPNWTLLLDYIYYTIRIMRNFTGDIQPCLCTVHHFSTRRNRSQYTVYVCNCASFPGSLKLLLSLRMSPQHHLVTGGGFYFVLVAYYKTSFPCKPKGFSLMSRVSENMFWKHVELYILMMCY